MRVPLDPAWEHALVGVDGEVTVATDAGIERGARLRSTCSTSAVRRDAVEVTSASGATLFLLGGEPFEDDIVMWWNFVGRSHEEIVEAREAWEAASARFGHVVDHGDERIPAPPLPAVRLTRRRRRV